jgi:3',5'-cyclic AMP phosphodiesterase CpdA
MEISTVLLYIKDLFATIMILLTMVSPAFGGNGKTYEAENPDALVTSFAVVSDIHVETNNPASYQNLNDVLYGIKEGKNIRTAVYTGDNVMNGQFLENLFFYTALRAVKPAENNFVVAGNHDFGNGAGDYASLRNDFIRFNKFFLGNDFGKDYYYNVVDGCYMIVLTSEDPQAGDFTMGEEQFRWLEGVLKEAKAADAPIFVFNHFPLHYLDNDSAIHHSQLGPMLRDYGVDLFVHGHIHDDLGADNFYNYYGINSINLPRVTETTDYIAGDGIVVEVYKDEILVKGRDFISSEWIDGLEYRYPFG